MPKKDKFKEIRIKVGEEIKNYLTDGNKIDDEYIIFVCINVMQYLENKSKKLTGVEKKHILMNQLNKYAEFNGDITIPQYLQFLIDIFVSISNKDYNFNKKCCSIL